MDHQSERPVCAMQKLLSLTKETVLTGKVQFTAGPGCTNQGLQDFSIFSCAHKEKTS